MADHYIHSIVEYGFNEGDDTFEFYTGPFATFEAAQALVNEFDLETYCDTITTERQEVMLIRPPTYAQDILAHYYVNELGIKGHEIRDYLSDKPRQP